MFKYLFSFILGFSSLSAEQGDGWIPIEKVRPEPTQEREDNSLWVLFVKNLGPETFSVRFPQPPGYRYTDTGSMEITAEREGEIYQLTVQPVSTAELPFNDLSFPSEGKWVHEHYVQTPHYLYQLRTLSSISDSEGHHTFASSFFIEKNR